MSELQPRFASAFRRAISRDLDYSEETRLPTAREVVRGLDLDERRALARQVASEEGIKFRSAMRRVQRYGTEAGQQRGAHLREPAIRRLQQRAQRVSRRAFGRRFQRGLRVHAVVWIDPSPGRRSRPRPRTIDVELSPDELRAASEALSRGDTDEAAHGLQDAILNAYEGVEPGSSGLLAESEIDEVDEFDLGELE